VRTSGGHNTWCARDNRCGLREHRAEPIVFSVPHAGSGSLTRIAGPTGRQYAEIRLQVPLPENEPSARVRLTSLLAAIPELLRGESGHRPYTR
jgi:hypothetical protein